MKEIFKIIFGAIVLVLLFVLFLLDRLILTFLPWMESKAFRYWIYKDGIQSKKFDKVNIELSLIRVGAFTSGNLIIVLFKYLFL